VQAAKVATNRKRDIRISIDQKEGSTEGQTFKREISSDRKTVKLMNWNVYYLKQIKIPIFYKDRGKVQN
tara:strand:- start:6710 stop:6916 length:207 start_codon:yes stop_codon:yes gene_type:complete